MKNNLRRILCISLLVVFTLCIIYGDKFGEADIVFRKASQICMECIGIG